MIGANLAAVLYLVAARPLRSQPAGPVVAGHVAAGQPLRHDRHGHRHRHDARLSPALPAWGWLLVIAGIGIGGGIGAVVAGAYR
jgi:hypothetical protein